MTKLINQRTDNDCAIASMAMLLGVSYEDSVLFHRLFIGDPDRVLNFGMGDHDSMRVLEALGKTPVRLHQFYEYSSGLVTVPSLNIPGSLHSVYWGGEEEKCYDPQKGRLGKKYYTTKTVVRSFCNFITTMDQYNVDIFVDLEMQELREALKEFKKISNG